MPSVILNGKSYSGSTNSASVISYTTINGENSNVQVELDKMNQALFSREEDDLGMNEMVKALYNDLQRGTPVNFHFVTTGSEHTVTFDKAYSRILIFSNLNSTNTPLTVKLNETTLDSSNAALGYEQESSTWGLHYTVLNVDVKAGDILSVSSSGANQKYLGIAIIY